MNWLISNNPGYHKSSLIEYQSERFTISSDSKFLKRMSAELLLGIDGYILPRYAVFDKYCGLNQYELLDALIQDYDLNFIHYLKGDFTIVIVFKNEIHLFSDRSSIKKSFVYNVGLTFTISNNLKTLVEKVGMHIDVENIAIFLLFSHFIDGHTMFKNIMASRPAQHILITQDNFSIDYYWSPANVLKSRKGGINDIEYFSHYWNEIIRYYINYLKPNGLSITLTGGNDSRMVLASLLNLKVPLHAFTYGNPKSFDNCIAQKISQETEIPHTNYFPESIDSKWLLDLSKQILSSGNSLVNIHRAHRYDAAKREANLTKNNMIITGLMGGEYIKKPNHDLLIPPLMWSLIKVDSRDRGKMLIEKKLIQTGLRIENVNIDSVYDRIMAFLEVGNDFKKLEKKFLYTYLFYGCAHHTQDPLIFGRHMLYVINPFMDIDFLELLSQYEGWYLNSNPNILDRIFHSSFQIKITNVLAPSLLHIPYAKKGSYTANELLNHKSKYLLKRMSFFFRKNIDSYPASFPMGEWLYDFSKDIIHANEYDFDSLFEREFMLKELEKVKSEKAEEKWHIVTNPINIILNIKYYGKN